MRPKWMDEWTHWMCDRQLGADKYYKNGKWFTCRELAKHFDVSTNTALRRFDLMERWGRVVRREYRQGWFGYHEYRLTEYWYNVYSIPF